MGAYHSQIIRATSHGRTSYCIGFSWENVKEKLERVPMTDQSHLQLGERKLGVNKLLEAN